MRIILHFLKQNYYIFLFFLLEGISFALVVQYNAFQSSRFYEFTTEVRGVFSFWNDEYRSMWYLRQNNESLQRENAILRAELESSKLLSEHPSRSVTDSIYRQMYTFIPANVISNSTTKRNNHLVIDCGKKAGIEVGMAVICADGVVGIVERVTDRFSSVMSILHSDSKISAKIIPDGFSGSLIWDGLNYRKALLTDVPSNFKVDIGDEVVTSGYSLSFPAGIPIGTVDEVLDNEEADFHRLRIRFSTEYNTLKEVYVVKNLYKKEIDTLRINLDKK